MSITAKEFTTEITETVIPWKRRWSPVDEEEPSPENLFLWGTHDDTETSQPLSALVDKSCLVLLGEAASGKSIELKTHQRDLEEEGHFSCFLDLKEMSETALRDELQDKLKYTKLEKERPISESRAEDRDAHSSTLFLLIDSLDETRIVEPLRRIGEEVQDSVMDIRIRVACRSVHWAYKRQTYLRHLFTIWEEVDERQIEPLSVADRQLAAEHHSLDPEAFESEIQTAGVESLAQKPITLNFLLEEYKADGGGLSSTRTNLYQSAVQRLIRETDPSRTENESLDPEVKLRISKRLAALTMFCQFDAIWVDPTEAAPANDLALEDARLPLEEQLVIEDRDISWASIKTLSEATDSALLHGVKSSDGHEGRVQWVERTIAEFLAASYLKDANLNLKELLDVLAAPGDDQRGIAPQMYDVATWLAASDSDLFDHMVQTNPRALLVGDVASLSDDQKSKLVERLLSMYEQGKLHSLAPTQEIGFRHLSHPCLDDQLRDFLASSSDDTVRWVCVRMAWANRLKSISDALLDIALDTDEPLDIRSTSVQALGDIGAEDELQKLISLLQTPDQLDPKRSLRGSVLSVVYPDVAEVDDIIPHLVPPQTEYDPRYQSFVEREIFENVDTLTIKKLFELLEDWQTGPKSQKILPLSYQLDNFASQLLCKAAELRKNEYIRELLTRKVYTTATKFHRLPRVTGVKDGFRTLWEEDESLRTDVLNEIVYMEDTDLQNFAISPALKAERDLPTVLEKAKTTASAPPSKSETISSNRWSQLAVKLYTCDHLDVVSSYLNDSRVRDDFRKYAKRNKATHQSGGTDSSCRLIKALRSVVYGVAKFATSLSQRIPLELFTPDPAKEVESLLRELCREQDRQRKERKQHTANHQERTSFQISPEHLEDLIDQFEDSSEPSAVWQIAYQNYCRSRSTEDLTDITKWETWKQSDSPLQQRLVEAANRYLKVNERDSGFWLEKESVWGQEEHHAIAALRLLHREESSKLRSWENKMWERWASLLVAYEPVSDEDETELQELAAMAYHKVPDIVADSLAQRIKVVTSREEHPETIKSLCRLQKVWDVRLWKIVGAAIQKRSLPIPALNRLMKVLVNADPVLRGGYFNSLLCERHRSGSDQKGWMRAAEAAIVLLMNDASETWLDVYPALLDHNKLADRVIKRVASRLRMADSSFIQDLPSEALCRLYLRISELCPPSEDSSSSSRETHVTSEDMVAELRGSILKTLENRGDNQEIELIRGMRPDASWLHESVLRARETDRRKSWSAHDPEFVLQLFNGSSARLARSGSELLSAVESALSELEKELRGQPPAIRDLWSFVKRNKAIHFVEDAVQDAQEALNQENGPDTSSKVQDVLGTVRKEEGNSKIAYPKNEEAHSDYLSRYLERRLDKVVVSREVSVSPGDFVDLLVTTFVPGDNGAETELASVGIEVKCSWNSEVYSGVSDQLIHRYLRENECRHGVYFVGWHYCDTWTDADSRKQSARRGGLENLNDRVENEIKKYGESPLEVRSVVADLSL